MSRTINPDKNRTPITLTWRSGWSRPPAHALTLPRSPAPLLALCLLATLSAFGDDPGDFGPLFDNFPLTLQQGRRTEIAGPFYYSEQKETQHTWAIPPFFAHTE